MCLSIFPSIYECEYGMCIYVYVHWLAMRINHCERTNEAAIQDTKLKQIITLLSCKWESVRFICKQMDLAHQYVYCSLVCERQTHLCFCSSVTLAVKFTVLQHSVRCTPVCYVPAAVIILMQSYIINQRTQCWCMWMHTTLFSGRAHQTVILSMEQRLQFSYKRD